MRVLGHIHTLDDEKVIERSLQALLGQSYPVERVLLVDNGSTDSTLERSFPERVTVIRHGENRGTSGAVISGFRHAIDFGFDWVWLFDADSAPRPNALEKLFEAHRQLPREDRERLLFLASLPVDSSDGSPYPGKVFGPRGIASAGPEEGRDLCPIDAAMWTGCLYRVRAVQEVGLPSPDYVLDWGEYEYGYRAKKRGYVAFMHFSSLVDHNIEGMPSLVRTTRRLGPLDFTWLELPPIRCYYVVRNTLYFWLYEFEERTLAVTLSKLVKVFAFVLNFLVRPFTHGREILSCLRGTRDGLLKRMDRRY